MTTDLNLIREWYEDNGFPEAARESASMVRASGLPPALFLRRLRHTEKMNKWQLFLATEAAMAVANEWEF